jgi:hypothetical protein
MTVTLLMALDGKHTQERKGSNTDRSPGVSRYVEL